MADHDHSYKLLFSEPELVVDLLRGFVHEDWIARLDFATLEQVGGSFVTDDLRQREDDLIWRVRFGDQWLYVYLLLEFQSTVDRFMAVRLMTYLGLLYQDLIRTEQLTTDGLLPPVLPLVLYNGQRSWSAATDIAELVMPVPGGLERYRPRLHYLLLDEGRVAFNAQPGSRNLAAAVFQLERSRSPDDIVEVISALLEWLNTPQQLRLRRAFTVWLNRVLLPRRLPGQIIPAVNELQEVRAMLSDRVEEWTRSWREQGIEAGRKEGIAIGLEEGRQEGRKEGRQEGRQEGECLLLLRLLERKFGPLTTAQRQRVESSDADTLLDWGERVLIADTVDDVFEDR